ncbi:DNA-binding transcriptional regulator, LysR family [Devosia lucknowensis]|uniref:DNA-binding transcriptional regulator, LysR family n=1 Tax=Devosia lucknowensis TaxID=1096929 RepID=A0A1Y6GEC5_9HYPH|nr:LysR family transcriptional regulator [Devosia lucknowensis]SMQ86170.1 DNA-binding transcriptional regulator, LysR family [Devosia lucknowensis]
MRDINLKGTLYFEGVARLGSVTKAASELGVSPSAVSQQIVALEAQFGVKLFKREKRRLVLTIDGDRLYQTTSQAFGALRNVRNAISRQKEVRNLSIRVSPSFGVRWLGPRMASFSNANPEWNLRVDATPDFTYFDTEAIDLDLRYGHGGWSGLSVTCIMNDLVMPMCSPEYLAELRAHSDDIGQQLQKARLIDSVKMLFRWDLWLAYHRITLDAVQYPFRFDRSTMSIELAKQGGGIALDSVNLCLPELQRGELVPFCPQFEVIHFPAYWLVCPQRHLNRRIVNLFAEWITRQCRLHELNVHDYLHGAGCFFEDPTELNVMSSAP